MESLSLRPEQARRAGRPEAAAVCFDWQSAPVDTGTSESSEAMSARKRGFVQTAITASLGAVLYAFVSVHAGTVVMGIACVLLTTSMVFPLSLFARIESLAGALAAGLQKGVTWLLMFLIFAFFFAPFGKLFRRGKRDKLKRWMEPEQESYWNDRSEPITAESRKRLY